MMSSWPGWLARTIQKPHSAFQRSLTSPFSKFEGTPTLIVLGGSARTLGNMNRPSMTVRAPIPAVKDAQPATTQETASEPSRKPRRASARAACCAEATAASFEGRGATALGRAGALVEAALAAAATFAGVA